MQRRESAFSIHSVLTFIPTKLKQNYIESQNIAHYNPTRSFISLRTGNLKKSQHKATTTDHGLITKTNKTMERYSCLNECDCYSFHMTMNYEFETSFFYTYVTFFFFQSLIESSESVSFKFVFYFGLVFLFVFLFFFFFIF